MKYKPSKTSLQWVLDDLNESLRVRFKAPACTVRQLLLEMKEDSRRSRKLYGAILIYDVDDPFINLLPQLIVAVPDPYDGTGVSWRTRYAEE